MEIEIDEACTCAWDVVVSLSSTEPLRYDLAWRDPECLIHGARRFDADGYYMRRLSEIGEAPIGDRLGIRFNQRIAVDSLMRGEL